MSDALTTTVEVDPAINIVYQRTLLQPATPKYVHNKFAQKFNIARKSGNTMKFRRYARYSAATTPLTEGVTPNGHKQSKVDLLAQVSQYGDFATITDVVDLTVQDPNITIEVTRQNDQMMNTLDQLTRDVLAASASSTACSNGSNGNTPTELNKTDIDAVRSTLRGNNADYMTQLVKAGTGQGIHHLVVLPCDLNCYIGVLYRQIDNIGYSRKIQSVTLKPLMRRAIISVASYGFP